VHFLDPLDAASPSSTGQHAPFARAASRGSRKCTARRDLSGLLDGGAGVGGNVG